MSFGLNPVKSQVNLSPEKIIALCESLLERMDDTELRRIRTTDPDRYSRTLKKQFSELDDRYPSIFNALMEFGRRTPDGYDTMARIRSMLGLYSAVQSGQKTNEQAEKELDYEYSSIYVKPVVGAQEFDRIVKPPTKQ
jgi:hypothetical protein